MHMNPASLRRIFSFLRSSSGTPTYKTFPFLKPRYKSGLSRIKIVLTLPPESGGPTPSGTTAPAPLELCRPAAPTTQRHRSPGRCPEDSCWLGIENGAAAQRHLAGLHRAVAAVTAVAALAAFIAAPAFCRLWRRSRRHCVRVVPRNTSRVASLSHPSQHTQPARR